MDKKIDTQHTVLFTKGYKSGEVESGIYDEKYDIWSLGILVKYLLYCDTILENELDVGKFDKKLVFSIELREVLDKMLKDENNQKKRFSCNELLNLKFFNGEKKNLINYTDYKDCQEKEELFKIDLENYSNYSKLLSNLIKINLDSETYIYEFY